MFAAAQRSGQARLFSCLVVVLHALMTFSSYTPGSSDMKDEDPDIK